MRIVRTLFAFGAVVAMDSTALAKQDTGREAPYVNWDGFDWDNNGSLNADEFTNWGYSEGWNGPQISNYFNRADTNGDGEVTKQEYASSGDRT